MAKAWWIVACAGLAFAGLAIALLMTPDPAPRPSEPAIMILPGAPVGTPGWAPLPPSTPSPAPDQPEDGRDPPAPRDPNSPNYADLGVLPAI
jgi:hypothetical protein